VTLSRSAKTAGLSGLVVWGAIDTVQLRQIGCLHVSARARLYNVFHPLVPMRIAYLDGVAVTEDNVVGDDDGCCLSWPTGRSD
jgi:hypothetical protein